MAPTQRVTRYPLLFTEINGLCDKAKAVAAREGETSIVEQKKKDGFLVLWSPQEAYMHSFKTSVPDGAAPNGSLHGYLVIRKSTRIPT